jgi:hypothetical protein
LLSEQFPDRNSSFMLAESVEQRRSTRSLVALGESMAVLQAVPSLIQTGLEPVAAAAGGLEYSKGQRRLP